MPFIDRASKLKFKRRFRRRRRDVESISKQADQQFDELIIRRLNRLSSVRRFVGLWLLLIVMITFAMISQIRALSAYYQESRPVKGGFYSEGLVGTFTNANPLYATGAADTAVSHLVFSGLLKYDQNNALVGDLAQSWKVDAKATRYVVTLNRNVKWHDGKQFTADDVVYTYQTIQNFDAKSSLFSSWQGIKITKQDDYVVSFDLPNPLSSFPYALTNGIVPAHILKNTPPEQLRSANFNINPVGTGPFKWSTVEVFGQDVTNRQQRITLSANRDYFKGDPSLDGFTFRIFRDDKQLIESYKKKEIVAISGLNSVPNDINPKDMIITYTPLTSAVMVFFNTSKPMLQDVKVRKALMSSVDTSQLRAVMEHPVVPVDSALLKGQLGYDPALAQTAFNAADATAQLDAAGWKVGKDGIREKDGKQLTIMLRSQNTPSYIAAAQQLQKVWSQLGVKLDLRYLEADDLQAAVISPHDYDALLYGISIGVDPDVFAYWHSSQASPNAPGHLNLSEYKSTAADQALEAGRTRIDPAVRATKYHTFLEAWRNDAPALALYQPNYIYISHGPVYGMDARAYNSGIDRFSNVANWMIREQKQDI